MNLPLVLIVALIALVVWLLFSSGNEPSTARSRIVTISWLVAQCFLLATAFHYIGRSFKL